VYTEFSAIQLPEMAIFTREILTRDMSSLTWRIGDLMQTANQDTPTENTPTQNTPIQNTPTSVWKYIWLTVAITVGMGVAASIAEQILKTSLSGLSIVGLFIAVRHCAQMFGRDHNRQPTPSEATRYAAWTTLTQAVFGVLAIGLLSLADPTLRKPDFFVIVGGIGLVMLGGCFAYARYAFVSAAKVTAKA
jgi:hypothetical protein